MRVTDMLKEKVVFVISVAPVTGAALPGSALQAERNVPFARHETRGGVEPDPARPGDVRLAPGMQVGEILLRAGGSFERLDVGGELDEVARGEARGDAAIAQQLDQQPRRIAAGALARGERLLGRLDARFHADQVVHVLAHHRVDADEEVDGADGLGEEARARALEPCHEERRLGDQLQVGRELARVLVAVHERKLLRAGVDEEVETG
jgi:hypothetical protein